MVHEYTNKTNINEGKVAIKFYASWCGPCRALGPRFENFSKEYPNITFIEVDVDKYPNLVSDFSLRGVPVVVTLKDGEVKNKIFGNEASSVYIEAFKSLDV